MGQICDNSDRKADFRTATATLLSGKVSEIKINKYIYLGVFLFETDRPDQGVRVDRGAASRTGQLVERWVSASAALLSGSVGRAKSINGFFPTFKLSGAAASGGLVETDG